MLDCAARRVYDHIGPHGRPTLTWRRGVVVSGVRRMNEVSTWMGDRLRAGISSRYVTSQLAQLSLASLRGRLIEYQLRLG